MKLGYILNAGDEWNATLDLARHAAATGWDSIWFPDHLMPPGVWFTDPDRYVAQPWHEAWTTLAALAAVVPRVRLGHIVTSNLLRHPAVLAKMAATVDHVSGGRLTLGLGAGYLESEHTAYGIPLYTPNERLLRLDEACKVLRSLFDEDRSTYSGRYYQLKDAPLEPKPVQRRIPLLLAGTGEKVALRIVARHADVWNMPGRPEIVAPKSEILDAHCRSIGRDPRAIERSALICLRFTDAANEAALDYPQEWTISGTSSEIAGALRGYADIGVDHAMVVGRSMGSTLESRRAGMDRFMKEVAPGAR